MSTRKLKRNSHDKMIAGVCGGIADFFGIDSTLVRVGYVLLSVFSAIFPSIVVYLILAFVMPED
ncbi:MAG: PspC domain-containing protein [Rhodothermales bacterium]|nr:PspC domain-containing protein [Rhodothermales bacterium]MDG2017082.1 PspC domain-containing protein [Rhodothermales bacterium]HAY37839.1 PspC domain-containing protein [Bacteroidota bacterium]